MTFFSHFKPTWMVESIYNITPAELVKYNFKGVMADLDNTLVAWNNPRHDDITIQWVEQIKGFGIPVVIVSNNHSDRIRPLADALDVSFVSSAFKPLSRGFKEGQKHLDLPKNQILMVGDQLLTDIFGGNCYGLDTVLVKPIVPTDAGATRFNRKFESLILKALLKNNQDMKWRHSLDEPLKSTHD